MLRVQIEPQDLVPAGKNSPDATAIFDQPVSLISARGTELCVVCHTDTGVTVREPVATRQNYVDG
ncbi:hypothetical protein V3474_29230, partial [Pseudomonas aeruginosa]|uniref:hypothetical protein n=1 Tax=Pseudomonas aeruginosa TaxID=287 RepID=UPI002F92ECB6